MSAIQQILQQRIIAVIRLDDYARAVDVSKALADGGVNIVEFTLTGSGAIDALSAVRRALGDKVCVGAGSVMKPEEALAAIDAGAEFVVTPAVRKLVITTCAKLGTPVLCGGTTPTELLEAYEAGSELVKLFPAQLGGPKYVKDILAPLPFLKIVPTGGVSTENARDYLAAGAVAVGMGGNLVPGKAVSNGAFEEITAAARACVAAVRR